MGTRARAVRRCTLSPVGTRDPVLATSSSLTRGPAHEADQARGLEELMSARGSPVCGLQRVSLTRRDDHAQGPHWLPALGGFFPAFAICPW